MGHAMTRSVRNGCMLGYFLVMVMAGLFYWGGLAAAGIFFLYTSWKYLKWAILIMAVVIVLSFRFPLLASIAFVLMILFFLLRISFIIKHWRPLLVGIGVYGGMLFMWMNPYFPHVGHWGMSLAYMRDIGFEYIGGIAGISFAFTAMLGVSLDWLGRHGYTARSAFGIMGMVPLILLGLLLPFLKLAVFTDGIFTGGGHAGAVMHGGAHTGDGMVHAGGIVHDSDGAAHTGDGPSVHHPNPNAADPVVHVGPYEKADGTAVAGHVRTLPDGDPNNNLSSPTPRED